MRSNHDAREAAASAVARIDRRSLVTSIAICRTDRNEAFSAPRSSRECEVLRLRRLHPDCQKPGEHANAEAPRATCRIPLHSSFGMPLSMHEYFYRAVKNENPVLLSIHEGQLPSGYPPRCKTMGHCGRTVGFGREARQPPGGGFNPRNSGDSTPSLANCSNEERREDMASSPKRLRQFSSMVPIRAR
jgi:hypothetical protein